MQELNIQKNLNKASRLGKGIASLIRESSNESEINLKIGSGEPKNETSEKIVNNQIEDSRKRLTQEVEINLIKENDYQPRKIFKEKEIEELAQSIKENGIIQPILVSLDNEKYRIVAGERRFRAAKRAGLLKIPVIIKETTDKDRLVLALIENVQRADLNCVEEALAYYQLMEEFKLTQEEVSKKIGKDRSTIANFLRILKLPRQVIDFLQKDLLTFGHAKVLAAIKEEEKVIRLANEVVESSLSVRQLEGLVNKKTIPAREGSGGDSTRFEDLRKSLENKTGYHFIIKQNNKGQGSINIKFNNDAEFNDIFGFLMRGNA